ncbi:MAG: hypothetical protein WAL35_06495, partial [Acidimicrobiales bacterium]
MATTSLGELGRRAKAAARILATAATAAKNDALERAADALGQAAAEILAANAEDVGRAESSG